MSREGILQEASAPYAHAGRVEVAIRTVQDTARAMLYDAYIKTGFWAEAVDTAVYILNRTTNTNDSTKTKFELFFGRKPDMSMIRTFGCSAYAKCYDELRKKWDEKSFKGVFVGYDELNEHCWRIYNPVTHTFIRTRGVIFDETLLDKSVDYKGSREDLKKKLDELFPSRSAPMEVVDEPKPVEVDPIPIVTAPVNVPVTPIPMVVDTGDISEADEEEQDSSKLSTTPTPPPLHMFTRVTRSISKSLLSYRCATAISVKEPNTIKQAMKTPQWPMWKEALGKEIASLYNNDTFQVMMRPVGIRKIGLKYLFKVKENPDGTVERYKARCVALGNLQREGFDYDETFAPVTRYSSIRALCAISAKKGHVIHQMDVDTAFLYGVMPDDNPVYCDVPEHYPIPDELKHLDPSLLVARCKRSIYGLKQSPRIWNENVHKSMISMGFTRSLSDSCLYHRKVDGTELYVAIYVDDIMISGSSLKVVKRFKTEMAHKYRMKDMGPLKYFLGIEIDVDNDNNTISLGQKKYANDVLVRFGMADSKPALIPMEPGCKLSVTMGPKTPEEIKASELFPYREIVGSLMYLMTCTRPDLAYSVGQLAKYMNCHGPKHHAAALQVLRYVRGTTDLKLTYGGSTSKGPLEVVGYSDSDWAANIDTRRSTTAYMFFLCGGPISWKSKSQPTVALSSTEAEYMALTAAAQEAMGLRPLCADFGINIDNVYKPILIHEDNMGCIAMSLNPVMHQTAKHIDIKHHFIREKVANNDVRVVYISTDKMLADALTKPLAKITFLRLRDVYMGGKYPTSPIE